MIWNDFFFSKLFDNRLAFRNLIWMIFKDFDELLSMHFICLWLSSFFIFLLFHRFKSPRVNFSLATSTYQLSAEAQTSNSPAKVILQKTAFAISRDGLVFFIKLFFQFFYLSFYHPAFIATKPDAIEAMVILVIKI